ncbi:bifunctional glycosyltransferase/class I SAM-dependent methyltransferase [Spirulina sp. 06S082]|uniref:bifunctional glycosyltransferase/class I SAM-dependent methyltransferase n=1 Tax=Spirulina sp. 06S082 TaxID=3110248 RepID=UPI002B1FA2FF|nr:bifunctional glycosyltransferase/class I SAM-dependent methyltransferase [Spirulina sp. 06S082]MEA5471673.1 bifunctional glycosyltransferase/class I SAM-dependent methyltransferase [Spirulina sp. 06S082]
MTLQVRKNKRKRQSILNIPANNQADNQGKKIGILIVAYNAVDTLAKVFKRIPQNVWNNVKEVVVFDDASQDNTYELANDYKTTMKIKHLKVFKNPKNLGYGGNQKLGYQYLIDRGFDVVVLLHGDGQYAPEILSHLYHPIVTGEADAVFGSRMMPNYGGAIKGGMPLYKFIGNKILTTFENWSLGMNLTEFHSGYRAYNLKALAQIDMSAMTNDFHFDTEIIIKLHHQKFSIKEVPIPTYYGNEICYVNGLKYAKDVFQSVRRYKKTIHSIKKYPEYKEYYIHYPIKKSKYSSHDFFVKLVGSNSNILDIGCGEGFFASLISQNNNKVTGIDLINDPDIKNKFQRFIQADLENGLEDAVLQLKGEKFDKVLLLDILEHLRFPEILLRDCHSVLDKHGQLLVSVPNIANITIRLFLLIGRWNYTERGILDKTHYRFYTRHTVRHLLENNGYKVVKEMMSVMPIELVLGLSANNPLMVIMNRLLAVLTKFMPELLGYQCIMVALPKHDH